jgi:hypothetical protein
MREFDDVDNIEDFGQVSKSLHLFVSEGVEQKSRGRGCCLPPPPPSFVQEGPGPRKRSYGRGEGIEFCWIQRTSGGGGGRGKGG